MNHVIRTHVKDASRLQLLERTIQSSLRVGLKPHVVDDFSPMVTEVEKLCIDLKVEFNRAKGISHTINGLVESFYQFYSVEPVLCTVDDMVFGKGAGEVIQRIEHEIIPKLPDNWGLVGMFACYEGRTPSKHHPELWHLKTDALYALVCHVFSAKLQFAAMNEWRTVLAGERNDPNCCDDIWIKRLMLRDNLIALNTLNDYAQHTGMGERTFGDDKADTGSNYQSMCFVGE